jgi:hypothetical protein
VSVKRYNFLEFIDDQTIFCPYAPFSNELGRPKRPLNWKFEILPDNLVVIENTFFDGPGGMKIGSKRKPCGPQDSPEPSEPSDQPNKPMPSLDENLDARLKELQKAFGGGLRITYFSCCHV